MRNNNSNRFNKFIQIYFNASHQIKNYIIQNYLLKQSRITFQSPNEKNYHVFYQLITETTAAPKIQNQFFLLPIENYYYLNQNNYYHLSNVNDSKIFDKLRLTINILNIQSKIINKIFSILSTILLIKNISFKNIKKKKNNLTKKTKNILKIIYQLLEFKPNELTKTLLFRQIQIRKTITNIPYKIQKIRNINNNQKKNSL